MRIKTQYILSIAIFIIILAIITASVVITNQQLAKINNEIQSAGNIETGASNLAYVSNDYFLYQQTNQLSEWQTQFTSLSRELSKIASDTPQEQSQINTLLTDTQNLNAVFNSSVSFLENAPRNETVRVLPEFQTDWSKLAVQNQALGFDASILSKSFSNQADQIRQTSTLLILGLISAFAVYFISVYFLVYRRTLRSISNLQDGTKIIGSGNLDYSIASRENNEIGELSQAFNQMTANLKTVTASKSDLEIEIAERKKMEEALKQRTEQLEQTQTKLEENAVQLEEYSSQMEELAEQRANQLKDAERLAAIGATAGMVGHDIRNPLQAITGDVFLAKTELASMPDSEEKKNALESMNEIEKNIDYINKIVQDLQDYARPLNPMIEESDLKSVIEGFIAKNGLPKNITVKLKIADEARKIRADSYYLNRILFNLVTNAVQAMPDGGKLTIDAHKEADDTVLSVKDTGVGIPREIQDKMFTLMFTTKSKGQGFGLPVVKRMTESLGGTVTFESQEGKGTTFIVRLPPPKKKELNGKLANK